MVWFGLCGRGQCGSSWLCWMQCQNGFSTVGLVPEGKRDTTLMSAGPYHHLLSPSPPLLLFLSFTTSLSVSLSLHVHMST